MERTILKATSDFTEDYTTELYAAYDEDTSTVRSVHMHIMLIQKLRLVVLRIQAKNRCGYRVINAVQAEE